jgi:hypothetical protein
MHLRQANVPLEVIALWLGHEQPAVTHTYVQADLKMKRECMRLLEQPSKPRRKSDTMRFSRLLSFLEPQ